MCGIFGVISLDGFPSDAAVARAHEMQGHRGPDARDTWQGRVASAWVTLGHERLAIIDTSEAGVQPFRRHRDGGVISFNGELYNYLELQQELAREGESFATRTDTEVLLAALEHWGPETALPRSNGMWAFAWLDARASRVVLSRDRAGEKPLYLLEDDRALYFASEVKTLLVLVGRRLAVDTETIGEFFAQGALDTSDRTFFSGVRQLPAASFGVVALDGRPPRVSSSSYWTERLDPGPPLPLGAFTEQLRATFEDSVRLRLRSDVPVGVLLSGGLDSSSIAAVAHRLVGRDAPLAMLSAVSRDPRFDESPFVDAMAAHLQRPVHKVTLDLDPIGAFGDLDRVVWHNDAPVASFSSVAHFRLMERARDLGITVVLSGQGGDELLCGYRKYLGFHLQSLVRRGRLLSAATTAFRFWRTGSVLSQFSLAEARRYLGAGASGGGAGVLGPALAGLTPAPLGLGRGSVQQRQLRDIERFSVPALCHYEDRCSMAFGREIRLPFLDERLIGLCVAAPVEYKLRDGFTKYAMRVAMAPLLPPQVAWRTDKQGFVNPEGIWLRNELRPYVLDHFGDDSMLARRSLVNVRALRRHYEAFCRQPPEGGRIWVREILAPLITEVWLRRFADYLA